MVCLAVDYQGRENKLKIESLVQIILYCVCQTGRGRKLSQLLQAFLRRN